MFKIVEASTELILDEVRQLFLVYGQERSFDKALGEYDKEMQGLPGKYGPPDGKLLIGYVQDKPAGCVAYQKLDSRRCEMKRLFVAMEYRKLGLGKLLALEILRQAQENGYQKMMLDTHPSMISAQNLYTSLGFTSTGRYNSNPIEGILFFEKELN